MKSKPQLWLIALAGMLCLAVCLGAAGEGAAFPGEPEGFGGLTWGTPKEALEPVRYVGTDNDGILLYERAGDEPYFGRARLVAIQYGFKDGRLATGTLKVDSLLQYLLMKEEALRRYGRGRELTKMKDGYVWNGERTQISLVGNFSDS